ncbi:LuxR family transcriptional regulator [Mycolicibacterium llatzerense]|nr:LuxR family transcriptional regulator [Mycolicibacterium llatzerense]
MNEAKALAKLKEAHDDIDRLDRELAAARERRRDAARRLIDQGRSLSWIADQLHISRQAVDSFLKYRQRRSDSRPL